MPWLQRVLSQQLLLFLYVFMVSHALIPNSARTAGTEKDKNCNVTVYVRASRGGGGFWIKKSKFKPLCLTPLQSIYEALLALLCIYFCQATQMPPIKSLCINWNSLHYQWREKLYQTKKLSSKMMQTALLCKIDVFLFELPYYFKTHHTIVEML